jgi:hypothetical protein
MMNISFYSPSLISQLLSIGSLIVGIVLSLFFSSTWLMRGLAIAVTVAATFVAWYGYGFVLHFEKSDRTVLVRARLLGMSLWRDTRQFDDIENLEMRYDGDGFPFIRVDFRDRSTYSFFSLRTEQDYKTLRSVVEVPE